MQNFKKLISESMKKPAHSGSSNYNKLPIPLQFAILALPAFYDKIVSYSYKCPDISYQQYTSPSICVFLLSVILTVNYWFSKRKSIKKEKVKRRIMLRILLALATIVITIGITVQSSKYYSCYVVGPKNESGKNFKAIILA
ncbi:hypothetical protein HZS_6347 [Henneguya salminicola]|nr:hypothetical protein HZS_6347 [Henneguya salminicola]